MTVPFEFVRALGLNPGDSVTWDAEGDVATLKFYKVERTRTPAFMNQGATVEAE
jgi:bifunctional DNA-binding transcriptional regulator/antitoxin component of YhaV-PrlF toxin-antitoxin module